MVRSDSLATLGPSGVANDLGEHLWIGMHPLVEQVGRLAETESERTQHHVAERRHLVHPCHHRGTQLGQRRGPLVGATQTHPRRVVGLEQRRRAVVRADVDLIAPVGLAARVLHTEPGVALEIRRVGVDDLGAVGVGQGEEPPREIEHRRRHRRVDAVATEMGEADLVEHPDQLAGERPSLHRGRVVAERCDVQDGDLETADVTHWCAP